MERVYGIITKIVWHLRAHIFSVDMYTYIAMRRAGTISSSYVLYVYVDCVDNMKSCKFII